MVSSIDGINQTNHSTNKQRPCANQERAINLSILEPNKEWEEIERREYRQQSNEVKAASG